MTVPLSRWLADNADWLAQSARRAAPRELEALFGTFPENGIAAHLGESLRQLARAVALGEPGLWVRDAVWLTAVAVARGADATAAARCWNRLAGLLTLNAPPNGDDELSRIALLLRAALAVEPETGLGNPLAREYFTVLDRSLEDVHAFLHAARASGISAASLYVDALCAAQRESGLRWQADTMSVAEEHRRTAVTYGAMLSLSQARARETPRGRLLAACAPGEEHALGLTMVTALAEEDGWDVVVVPGSPSKDAIAAAVALRRPDVVALSASLSATVCALVPLIARLRAECAERAVTIVVGGGPFVRCPDLWRVVGADATASNAVAAVRMLAALEAEAPGERVADR